MADERPRPITRRDCFRICLGTGVFFCGIALLSGNAILGLFGLVFSFVAIVMLWNLSGNG
jgi:hypothetical protein